MAERTPAGLSGESTERTEVGATSVPAWLADPALSRLWEAVRTRLERSHLTPSGRIMLADLTRDERHAVGGLLARTVVADRVTVDLAELDQVLARRSPYHGLAATVAAVTGRALRDRRAERSAASAAREAPFALARELLAAHPVLADATWGEAWLAGVRRSGLLARSEDAAQTIRRAVDVTGELVRPEPSAVSRVDLAARVVGDAHGLDDGTVLAQLVLRALALDAAADPPTSTTSRRSLWERYGVYVDTVSSTCLALGVLARSAAAPGGSLPWRLDLAAAAGDPVHITSRDLRGVKLAVHRDVLVCENPRVLEAVAEITGGTVPVVCTAGQPALVVVDVLRRLAVAGATLRYHGDFDWPGIAIANRLVGEIGVAPWKMSASAYADAVRRGPAALELAGRPVAACWDPALEGVMTRYGIAVHEEAVLDDILDGVTSFLSTS